jgi:alpha-beta hydrolase superfamily lysophospholipase
MGGLGHAQLAKCYRAAGNVDVDDRRYPEARHELINETNRNQVWSDIVGWIREHSS